MLPEMVVTMLRDHRRRQDDAKADFNAKAEPAEWEDPGLVFTTAAGQRVPPESSRGTVRQLQYELQYKRS